MNCPKCGGGDAFETGRKFFYCPFCEFVWLNEDRGIKVYAYGRDGNAIFVPDGLLPVFWEELLA